MSEFSKVMDIIEIKCPRCGYNQSYKRIFHDGSSEFGECMKCGEMTYIKFLKSASSQNAPTVECPYCHSTNTKKISRISKAGNVALWGIFATSKVAKQWHCNNCKSDF